MSMKFLFFPPLLILLDRQFGWRHQHSLAVIMGPELPAILSRRLTNLKAGWQIRTNNGKKKKRERIFRPGGHQDGAEFDPFQPNQIRAAQTPQNVGRRHLRSAGWGWREEQHHKSSSFCLQPVDLFFSCTLWPPWCFDVSPRKTETLKFSVFRFFPTLRTLDCFTQNTEKRSSL